MKFVGRGPMVIVDASCLYDILARKHNARRIEVHLATEPDQAAPHCIDVEVISVIRRDFRLGRLDFTAASQAVHDLRDWRGHRFGHLLLLERAWELRDNVRSWDAMYVALAEAFQAPLLTTDERLANAMGPRCSVELFQAP